MKKITTQAIIEVFGTVVTQTELYEVWEKEEVKEFLTHSDQWERKKVAIEGERRLRWVYLEPEPEIKEVSEKIRKKTRAETLAMIMSTGVGEEKAKQLASVANTRQSIEEDWQKSWQEIIRAIETTTNTLKGFESKYLKAICYKTYIDYSEPNLKDDQYLANQEVIKKLADHVNHRRILYNVIHSIAYYSNSLVKLAIDDNYDLNKLAQEKV